MMNIFCMAQVDTGERCINFLKESNVGRGNFIVLEKIVQWGARAKDRFDAPENVPRLFDLVEVEDERVLSAFYFSLRDTLVAKDIEQASRIGLGGRTRYRVVDLVGNIVEPGGE
jgi:structural maintenance of chromosome 4